VEMADLALHDDLAFGDGEVARDELHQRRLAGAVVAHQADHFARVDRQADVVDGTYGAKALRYVFDLEQRQIQSPSHVESWRQAPPARARFSPCSAKTGSCLRLVRADLAYVQAEARTITRLVGRTEVRTKERPHDGCVQAVSEGNCDGSVDAALRDSQ